MFVEHVDMQPIDAQTTSPQLFYGLRKVGEPTPNPTSRAALAASLNSRT